MLQKEDGWCGPVALSYALKKYGKQVSQEKIAKETDTTQESGMETWNLKKSVIKHGFVPQVLPSQEKDKTFEIIKFLVSTKIPVLIDYLDGNSQEDGHYAVIDKISGDEITLFNPSKGEETISKDWLFKRWKDFHSNGKIFKNWAMAIFEEMR